MQTVFERKMFSSVNTIYQSQHFQLYIVEFPLAVNFMFINEGQHDPVTDDGTLKKKM